MVTSERKRERASKLVASRNTFGLVALEQIEAYENKGLAPVTLRKHRWLLTELASSLSSRPIAEITAAAVLELLRTVEGTGRRETAKKLRADTFLRSFGLQSLPAAQSEIRHSL